VKDVAGRVVSCGVSSSAEYVSDNWPWPVRFQESPRPAGKDENMNVTDPIADMLTRIRNAAKARHKSVDIPSSRLKREIARVLLENKFIKNFIEVPNPRQNLLRVFLGYTPDKRGYITGITRVSRPGLRVYLTSEELKRSKQAMGIIILTSSGGVLTDQQASQKGVGGEAICRVW